MSVLARLGYLLALLCLGLLVRRAGLLPEDRRRRMNAVAFYIALPALIFTSTYDEPISELLSVTFLVGIWAVMLATLLLAVLVHSRVDSRARRGVAVVQSYHSNFGYLGVPIVAAGMGSAAAGKASVVLGVGALTQNPVTVSLLTAFDGGDASLREEVGAVATNPIVVALLVGLAISATGVGVPAPAIDALELLGAAALPLALVLVGAALEPHLPRADYLTLGSVVGLNVFVMPLLAFLAFTLLGAPAFDREVAVVMFATPAAISTFVYAGELGGDQRFASLGVFVSTVISLVLITLLLSLS